MPARFGFSDGETFGRRDDRVAPCPLGNQSRQGTSLRLATRPWFIYTGEYGGSGPPGKPGAPAAVGSHRPKPEAKDGAPLRYGGLRDAAPLRALSCQC